jgi:excisionase family DNA binding protein
MTELFTRREAARRLHISSDQLAKLVYDGELKYVNVGRGKKRPRMRFTDSDIADFIERRSRREPACLSTRTNLKTPIASISGSEVIGFTARRQRDAKPKR